MSGSSGFFRRSFLPLETMIFRPRYRVRDEAVRIRTVTGVPGFENISRIGRSVGKMATGDKDEITRGDLGR